MNIFFEGFLVLSIVSMTYWLQVKAIVSIYRTRMMFYGNKKLLFDWKKETCVNIANEVSYHIKRYGRQTTEDKVQPIKKLLEPRNIKEMQAFLGMLS